MHWWLVTVLGVSMASSAPSHPSASLVLKHHPIAVQDMGMGLHPSWCIQWVHNPHATGEGHPLAVGQARGWHPWHHL